MEKNESQEKKKVINFDDPKPSNWKPKNTIEVIYPDGMTNLKPEAQQT